MANLKTLAILGDGEPFKSGLTGEFIHYAMEWEELREKAKEQSGQAPDDVRLADLALDALGIPHQAVEADISEGGDWIVYWR